MHTHINFFHITYNTIKFIHLITYLIKLEVLEGENVDCGLLGCEIV
jgi:hypothetical protein